MLWKFTGGAFINLVRGVRESFLKEVTLKLDPKNKKHNWKNTRNVICKGLLLEAGICKPKRLKRGHCDWVGYYRETVIQCETGHHTDRSVFLALFFKKQKLILSLRKQQIWWDPNKMWEHGRGQLWTSEGTQVMSAVGHSASERR